MTDTPRDVTTSSPRWFTNSVMRSPKTRRPDRPTFSHVLPSRIVAERTSPGPYGRWYSKCCSACSPTPSAVELVAFETYGDATPASRYILQSAGRSVAAGAAWKLLDDKAFGLDDRVADIVPEFATNGKEAVLVRHVLTHTAGLPFAPLGYP